jgi:YVTN family beta-propeller protein
MIKLAKLLALLGLITSSCSDSPNKDIWVINAPAGNKPCTTNFSTQAIIPNGRIVAPVGKSIITAPHPYGLAVSNDGNTIVTANSGTNPLSITIIRNALSDSPEVQQVPPGAYTDRGVIGSVFMGLALSPDNSIVYVSAGQENRIYLFDVRTGDKMGDINCATIGDSVVFPDGYIGDMALTRDGSTLFAVDQINFRLIIIDTETRRVMRNVMVGRYPFGIALSPDEKKVYVANVGMYVYQRIPGITDENVKEKGLKFPPFGYLTPESEKGTTAEGLAIPGLGDPHAPEAFSVFAVDISDLSSPRVTAKIKTGIPVGQPIEGIPAVGGASPNSLVCTSRYAFVSNGNNDNISVIDIEKDTVVNTIYLKPDRRLRHFRGVIPFGLAVSPDQKTLYVAESGINALGVIDIDRMKVVGHIPTAWFPAKLRVTSDGKTLVCTNAKGFGSGPNGGSAFKPGPEGTYIGHLMKGSVSIINVPRRAELKKLTRKVVDNNFALSRANSGQHAWRKSNPIPLYPREKESPIKYIVFISKENRTYDEVLGQIEKADGDPALARYGLSQTFSNRKGDRVVENADVMPNHLSLARNFAIADNFYVDADVSADGHRWLVNTYPNEWVETTTAASYGGNRDFNPNSKAPGIYAFNGAAGAIYPEDYNEAGSMWDHLERNGVEFFNFGFSVMFEPASYDDSYKVGGIRQYVNFPVPQPMFNRSSRVYPTYNTGIPDQFRVDMFIKEFREKWMDKGIDIPSVLTVIIPNDHGAGERPDAGYPFRESYMADNDLAVGRIVEFLSHTPYWKHMAIVITEDDAQNGVDHVDAHRSILLVISPYVKRDYVSHVHYSFGSIFKTFWNILGIPYLNQYDAGATDLADFFTETPDFRPYNAIASDTRVFDPVKALDPLDEKFDWKAIEESPELDNVEDMIKDSKEVEKDRLEYRERKRK